ncbi:MAG: quinolinate synthase NadA [Candidatus Brocadiaceae bacterium]|nr:quinolinate synthase NadA [Candidatus Brocadiaceae bacterium]
MGSFDTDVSVLREEIAELRHTRNAVILAHYYQRPSVQHMADYTGDSLELSRIAAETSADVIVFCGVRFMAETAAIVNPTRTVLLPEPAAGCGLAEMAGAELIRRRRGELPANTAVVSYVNTSAEVKAESDICCTSANAVAVVESLPHEHILFVPDRNLASYVAEQTDKHIIPWDGHCYVHDPNISTGTVRELKRLHPHAVAMAHPECNPAVRRLADFVGSTSQMLRYAAESEKDSFIVATEEGFVQTLLDRNPQKEFFSTGSVCASMHLTTLTSVRRALDRMSNVIRVPEPVREKAAAALNRMLEVR